MISIFVLSTSRSEMNPLSFKHGILKTIFFFSIQSKISILLTLNPTILRILLGAPILRRDLEVYTWNPKSFHILILIVDMIKKDS
jgi:hypothetical protein